MITFVLLTRVTVTVEVVLETGVLVPAAAAPVVMTTEPGDPITARCHQPRQPSQPVRRVYNGNHSQCRASRDFNFVLCHC